MFKCIQVSWKLVRVCAPLKIKFKINVTAVAKKPNRDKSVIDQVNIKKNKHNNSAFV